MRSRLGVSSFRHTRAVALGLLGSLRISQLTLERWNKCILRRLSVPNPPRSRFTAGRSGLLLFGRCGHWSRRRATTAIRQLAQRAASKASIVNFSLTMTEQAVGGLE